MVGSSLAFGLKPKMRARKGQLARCWLFGIALCMSTFLYLDEAKSQTNNKTNHYRQWAYIQLNNVDEFYCLDELYYHESRWNPSARNNSHYGIPQGRSKYLAKVDGYKQVEWGIAYNMNRYGSMCKALDHFKRKGWH